MGDLPQPPADGPTGYFTDRTRGPRVRNVHEVDDVAWGGIVALVQRRIVDGSLGHAYPEHCDDGPAVIGTDESMLGLQLRAEIPALGWPINATACPDTGTVFDLIEFVWSHVAQPTSGKYHSYFSHDHLSFEVVPGRRAWREDVNRILARNGLAFELAPDGLVKRLLPSVLQQQVGSEFDTGDEMLDGLLAQAAKLFADRRPGARRDAVEKLWDAFERAKTLRGRDKKRSIKQLLQDRASTPEFLTVLDTESVALTNIGNDFRIRHSETNAIELTESELEYLFVRLFALLWFLLRSDDLD